jgi:hypothetical protein
MARPRDRREHVVALLREALQGGRLRPGTQLRTGVLDAAAWGTSHPTFRAALRELERTGELERAPRGFRVPIPTVRGSATRVSWLSACDSDGTVAGEPERESRLRRHLDLACRRDGLHLRVVGIDPQGRAWVEGCGPEDLQSALRDAFGVVLSPWRMGSIGIELAERISRGGIPAAIWAEGVVQRPALAGGRTRIFDNGHLADPGRGVGIHLRELGHERIAFLSTLHGTNWSARRLEGLQGAMEGVGEVVPFLLDGPVAPPPLPRELLRAIESAGAGTRRYGALFARHLAEIEAACSMLLRDERRIPTIEPLFEKALSDRSITAWVLSNDTQALIAIHWLRARGIDVPGQISVVGFDDSNRGQDLGLTSWSFSEFDLAEAMVRHLVNPLSGSGAVRIDGNLVARSTTARRAS